MPHSPSAVVRTEDGWRDRVRAALGRGQSVRLCAPEHVARAIDQAIRARRRTRQGLAVSAAEESALIDALTFFTLTVAGVRAPDFGNFKVDFAASSGSLPAGICWVSNSPATGSKRKASKAGTSRSGSQRGKRHSS